MCGKWYKHLEHLAPLQISWLIRDRSLRPFRLSPPRGFPWLRIRFIRSVVSAEEREPTAEHDGPIDGESSGGVVRRIPGIREGPRRGWDVKEDDNTLYISVDMPELGKGDVKVWVEENTLMIKGEAAGEEAKEDTEEYARRRYSTRLDILAKLYKLDAIKAEMKNGVLRVAIPKVKQEERKDVFQVTHKGKLDHFHCFIPSLGICAKS